MSKQSGWSKDIGKAIKAHNVVKETPEEKRLWKLRGWGLSGKGNLKQRTSTEFQKMIRYEAADENGMVHCVTCSFSNFYKNTSMSMDAGHWLGGRTNAVLYVEEICFPQCTTCNKRLSGNQEVYTQFMIDLYGPEKVAELRLLRNEVVQFARCDETYLMLDDMRIGYRKRWKAAEKRILESIS